VINSNENNLNQFTLMKIILFIFNKVTLLMMTAEIWCF